MLRLNICFERQTDSIVNLVDFFPLFHSASIFPEKKRTMRFPAIPEENFVLECSATYKGVSFSSILNQRQPRQLVSVEIPKDETSVIREFEEYNHRPPMPSREYACQKIRRPVPVPSFSFDIAECERILDTLMSSASVPSPVKDCEFDLASSHNSLSETDVKKFFTSSTARGYDVTIQGNGATLVPERYFLKQNEELRATKSREQGNFFEEPNDKIKITRSFSMDNTENERLQATLKRVASRFSSVQNCNSNLASSHNSLLKTNVAKRRSNVVMGVTMLNRKIQQQTERPSFS